ncbi:MAG: DUF427 domain-containing protein [Rhizobiaceae bacterium]
MDNDLASNPAPGFKRNPSHRITTSAFDGIVEVSFGKTVIAHSSNALVLREGDYPPVYYLPMEDVHQELVTRSSHTSHCPFKGDASYWNVHIAEHEIDNAIWGYEMPYDEMLEIAGLVAFYPNKVTITARPD